MPRPARTSPLRAAIAVAVLAGLAAGAALAPRIGGSGALLRSTTVVAGNAFTTRADFFPPRR